jgi:tRNA(Arg) A34 adenosine deaminase TadA
MAAMSGSRIVLELPGWLDSFLAAQSQSRGTIEQRMQFAIDLAGLNVRHKTGGPFGAAVFEEPTGRLLGAGVNLVTWGRCSVLHAEIVALSLAQRSRASYDLGADPARCCQLVTTCEPCAMCLGAIPWSGVRSVICGASAQDAESIGFDEGAKPQDWISALEARGISVQRDVLRDQARAVLREYQQTGGVIY